MRDELEFMGNCRRGARGPRVKLAQEWITLHGFTVLVDQDFGPATQWGVMEFQRLVGLPPNGVVDEATWGALVRPMRMARRPPTVFPGDGVPELLLWLAQQHLAEHPREVGGQNMGPWVRLYMQGNEGEDWPWCAGFVSYLLGEAYKALMHPRLLPHTFSCDELAAAGQELERFLSNAEVRAGARPRPGDLFLVCNPQNPADLVHTGVVVEVHAEHVVTIEGNTNDEGSSNGFEVCSLRRAYKRLAFVLNSAR